MLKEDIGYGDVTTESLIPEGKEAKAKIIAEQSGYIAGIPEALAVFDELEVKAKALVSDGDKVRPGDTLIEADGPARGILTAERVALNLLSRMSGVATATREMLDKARKVNSKVQIAATRKTVPLLRKFDKKAVRTVGGEPHRYHLGDFVLIKDNHLKLVRSVADAVGRAHEANLSKKIEVEVDSLEGAVEAAKAEADVIMLDNMSPAEIRKAIKELKKEDLRDEVIIEASGGINPTNVGEYASTGVDILSSSYMTMQAPALDVSLEIED
ncbi:MAG: carboxylating nicotinate-nucleotide diphosphorylase [Candidatus Hadarchaeota archaeon]|nr:carboxylating nicotinate-nucleotide diphosphorylase [Candidatus Hadarchaeota archaeon]